MTKYDIYGAEASLDAIRGKIEAALGVEFELHESSYRGGDYYLWRSGDGAELILQTNFRDEEDELAEAEYPTYPVILYATIPDMQWSLRTVPDLVLLRSVVL